MIKGNIWTISFLQMLLNLKMGLSLRYLNIHYKYYINSQYLKTSLLFHQNGEGFRGFYFIPQAQDPRKTTKDFLMRGKIQIFSRGRCKTVLVIKR